MHDVCHAEAIRQQVQHRVEHFAQQFLPRLVALRQWLQEVPVTRSPLVLELEAAVRALPSQYHPPTSSPEIYNAPPGADTSPQETCSPHQSGTSDIRKSVDREERRKRPRVLRHASPEKKQKRKESHAPF